MTSFQMLSFAIILTAAWIGGYFHCLVNESSKKER
jgi:hypothetical protein